jgi:NAD-dependent SIR2 family protein deacetylase
VLKASPVLFDEILPRDALETASRKAQSRWTMHEIGTPALVQPEASLPHAATQQCDRVVEIDITRVFPDSISFCVKVRAITFRRRLPKLKGGRRK